jgi:hypothetical protein
MFYKYPNAGRGMSPTIPYTSGNTPRVLISQSTLRDQGHVVVTKGSLCTLPLALQVSGTFQSLPGPQILATRATPVAEIIPSLKRPLAGNVANASIALIEPGTLYGDRLNQLDFRVSRNFKVKGADRKLRVNLDLYNAFNASPAVFQNNTYGPQWQRPTSILSGRLVKLGAHLNF